MPHKRKPSFPTRVTSNKWRHFWDGLDLGASSLVTSQGLETIRLLNGEILNYGPGSDLPAVGYEITRYGVGYILPTAEDNDGMQFQRTLPDLPSQFTLFLAQTWKDPFRTNSYLWDAGDGSGGSNNGPWGLMRFAGSAFRASLSDGGTTTFQRADLTHSVTPTEGDIVKYVVTVDLDAQELILRIEIGGVRESNLKALSAGLTSLLSFPATTTDHVIGARHSSGVNGNGGTILCFGLVRGHAWDKAQSDMWMDDVFGPFRPDLPIIGKVPAAAPPALSIYPQTIWWGLDRTVTPMAESFNEPQDFTFYDEREFNSFAQFNGDTDGSEGWSTGEWAQSANLAIVQDSGAELSPPNSRRILYDEGRSGGTSPAGTSTLAANLPSGQRKLYHRFGFKVSSNWQGHSSSTNKIYHIWTLDGLGGQGNRIFYSMEGADANQLFLNGRLQGVPDSRARFAANVGGADGEIVRNQWYTIEVLMELNTFSGSTANSDGIYRWWMDGVLTHDYTDVEYMADGEQDSSFFYVSHAPTWGGTGDTVDEDMFLFMDHSYASSKT